MRNSCVIIGAGISGLLAARTLHDAGITVRVIDKARGVGGRMATRRIDAVRFDHGAQFIIARTSRFRTLINEWQAAGVARKWCEGFARPDRPPASDGHSRYCGSDGMTAIPKYLAIGLDISLQRRVTAIGFDRGRWQVGDEHGAVRSTQALIVTTPVPQSLVLFSKTENILPTDLINRLNRIKYDRCLAVMLNLAEPGHVPRPGAVQFNREPVHWIADNHQKGIAPHGYGLTIHAGPQFSLEHWDDDDERIVEQILPHITQYVRQSPLGRQVHRWRYSQCYMFCAQSFLMIDNPAPLYFAGDGFGSGRLEGAAVSGLQAADALLARWGKVRL